MPKVSGRKPRPKTSRSSKDSLVCDKSAREHLQALDLTILHLREIINGQNSAILLL